jgi:hypothetical protein
MFEAYFPYSLIRMAYHTAHQVFVLLLLFRSLNRQLEQTKITSALKGSIKQTVKAEDSGF